MGFYMFSVLKMQSLIFFLTDAVLVLGYHIMLKPLFVSVVYALVESTIDA